MTKCDSTNRWVIVRATGVICVLLPFCCSGWTLKISRDILDYFCLQGQTSRVGSQRWYEDGTEDIFTVQRSAQEMDSVSRKRIHLLLVRCVGVQSLPRGEKTPTSKSFLQGRENGGRVALASCFLQSRLFISIIWILFSLICVQIKENQRYSSSYWSWQELEVICHAVFHLPPHRRKQEVRAEGSWSRGELVTLHDGLTGIWSPK